VRSRAMCHVRSLTAVCASEAHGARGSSRDHLALLPCEYLTRDGRHSDGVGVKHPHLGG
jgi:hypothetical protein